MTPAILHWCVISESLRKKCVFVCRNVFCTFLHFACALENKSVWIVIQCWFPKSNIVDLYNHHWIWQSAQCKYKGLQRSQHPYYNNNPWILSLKSSTEILSFLWCLRNTAWTCIPCSTLCTSEERKKCLINSISSKSVILLTCHPFPISFSFHFSLCLSSSV